MRIAVKGNVSVEAVHETVNSSMVVLNILIHQAEIKVDRGDVWMVISTYDLKNVERLQHVLKSLRIKLATMVIETKIRVAICNDRVLIAQYFLLNYQTL